MKLKINEIVSLSEAIKNIIDDTDTTISPLMKFKLLGILKAIIPYVENFEIIKNDAIRKYGKTDENGNISVSAEDKESYEQFIKEIEPAYLYEVDVDIKKLSPEEIFGAKLPTRYLLALYSIIDGE